MREGIAAVREALAETGIEMTFPEVRDGLVASLLPHLRHPSQLQDMMVIAVVNEGKVRFHAGIHRPQAHL